MPADASNEFDVNHKTCTMDDPAGVGGEAAKELENVLHSMDGAYTLSEDLATMTIVPSSTCLDSMILVREGKLGEWSNMFLKV
jgi:hypothetical protein